MATRVRSLTLSLCTILLSAGLVLGASPAGQSSPPQAISVQGQALPSSQAAADTWRQADLENLLGQSSLAVWGRVTRADSFWQSDEHGRQIHTTVEISPLGEAIGHLTEASLVFEVVGGTVDGIAESVSDVPEFAVGEEAVVFVGGSPYRLAEGRDAKLGVYDGKVYWGEELPVKTFLQGLDLMAVGQSPEQLWESESQRLQVLAGPVITSIRPPKASAGTETRVTIAGFGFGANEGKVEFFHRQGEPKLAAAVILWSDTKIVCTVPSNHDISASSGPVTVRTDIGTSSNGFLFRVTFGYSLLKWSGTDPTIYYSINENAPSCSGEGSAIERAASTWNGAAGGRFEFKYGGSTTLTAPDLTNGKNDLMWGSANEVAVTHLTWDRRTDLLLECDVVFSDSYNWSANTSNSVPLDGYDVESVALHELGHMLSLQDLYGSVEEDVYDTGKVMYGYERKGDILRSLHDDDKAGIQWIYADLPSVLICGAVTDARYLADIQTKLMATGQFTKVDTMNVHSTTPSLATLQEYRAVMVFSDADYADPVALGNVMANYADKGCGVVCAVSEVAGSSQMQGRWDKGEYYAIPRSIRFGGSRMPMSTVYDLAHPIMQGVSTFNGGTNSYRSYANSVTPGTVRIADWLDGRPLVVTKVIGKSRRVDLGFFPVSSDGREGSWDASTDGARLMANSLTWAADKSPADIVLTFEGLTTATGGSVQGVEVPAGYGGLNWFSYFDLMDVLKYGTDSGYQKGCVSPRYVAYSAWEDPVMIGADQPFDFVGAYLTGAWRDGLKIDINGFRSGVLRYSRTVIVNSTYPTWIQLDYAGVDRVQFDSYEGVENPAYPWGYGEHFVIDDLTIRRP